MFPETSRGFIIESECVFMVLNKHGLEYEYFDNKGMT